MSIARQEFTTVGRDMLGRANAGETLSITRIVVGSGTAAAPADLWPLTELLEPQVDVTITQQIDQGDGILLVEGSFNSDAASAPFELRELGVMAHIAAEPDRLYSVSNVLATLPDGVDPGVPSVHAFKIKVVIDRAPNVTVVIGTSQDILAENIGAETVGPGWFKEKLANTLRFKRVIEGEGITVIDEPDSITIQQRILTVDLDLYVPLTHPDAPGPEVAFPTVQEAVNYLSQYIIPSNRLAAIRIAGSATPYSLPTVITVNHPQGDRIRIWGEPTTRYPILNAEANGINLIVQLSPADAANFVQGEQVLIESDQHLATTNLNIHFHGGHLINSIAGGTITLSSDYVVSVFAPAPRIGAWLRHFPTRFNCDQGFLDAYSALNQVRDIAAQKVAGAPTGSQTGIGLFENTNLTNVLMKGFYRGFNFTGNRARATGGNICGYGNVNAGCVVDDGASFGPTGYTFWNGNQGFGIWTNKGAILSHQADITSPFYMFAIANQGRGMQAASNSTISIQGFLSRLNGPGSNNTDGIWCMEGAFITFIEGAFGRIDMDERIYAEKGGQVIGNLIGTGQITDGRVGSINPLNDQVGNRNGYISLRQGLIGGVPVASDEPIVLPVLPEAGIVLKALGN